jgi:hypothetical protein
MFDIVNLIPSSATNYSNESLHSLEIRAIDWIPESELGIRCLFA